MYSVSSAYIAQLSRLLRHGTAAVCTAVGSGSARSPLGRYSVNNPLQTINVEASYATAADRQVLKLEQRPDSSSSNSKPSTWIKPLLSAAVAAAASAWTLWSDPPVNQAQADAAAAAAQGLSQVSQQTQGAVVSCFAGPLVALLQGLNPTEPQLQAMAKTLVSEASSLNPSDLLDALWGLAMLGAKLNPEDLQQLCGQAVGHLQQLTVYQAVVTVWSVVMLCGSSSSNGSPAAAQLTTAAWQQLLQRLSISRVEEYDEAAVLYLLHSAVQQAAAAAGAQQGEAKASLQEVLQQVDTLPRRVKVKVAAAYQEYVPFQGYIESPFLTILHIVKSLPYHIRTQSAAAAAAAAAENGAPPAAAAAAAGGGAHGTVFGGFTIADADAALTVTSDSSVLGKLKRELFFTWRSDQLLDRHQKNLNQVAHVLNRVLMLPLKQPADVDVLLPTLKSVILLEDDTTTMPFSSQSQVNKRHGQKQQHSQQLDTSDPQLAFKPQYWSACHNALVTLMRNRFSAPPGGFALKTTEGIRAAKERVLRQRGFKVVRIGMSEVEACMSSSGSSAGQRQRNKPADYSALEALLRSKLQL